MPGFIFVSGASRASPGFSMSSRLPMKPSIASCGMVAPAAAEWPPPSPPTFLAASETMPIRFSPDLTSPSLALALTFILPSSVLTNAKKGLSLPFMESDLLIIDTTLEMTCSDILSLASR